jgi:hypothetical protein
VFNQWSEWSAKIEAVKNIKGPKSYFLIGNLDIFQHRNGKLIVILKQILINIKAKICNATSFFF